MKDYLPNGLLREIRTYEVPRTRTYPDGVKYYCYLGDLETGEKILGSDLHAGKGPHQHVRGKETQYEFTGLATLLDDFALDVQAVIEGRV
ncbi:MAG TPA: DUF6516 family protein [Candidatus Binatia bacterium]|nr:DUF6516 family protein [Candidatus Binatia bacterium]